ncbi:GtrA family protein [Gloeobacter morelensis]|uniref:FAD-dependent oxidoreductase n=1 Tax=Gloeobacter morelensis MG652769 TaxID=2781736 RepID=A0ABY3PLY4_9CYAN|nr:GtrA family protein [Gloeobacter morelensis]UFP94691.1 FAD-dependent oxidoreductase [Gloeobacter morelensis MG652769]
MSQFDQGSAPVYVLGAGPAGLAAAYTLTKLGYPVVVVERDHCVGGLARSIEHQGFILDYGPHRFFTKLAPVLAFWDEVLGSEQVTVNRLTRIYYGGKYFSYPLKAFEALFSLGFIESARIVFSYAAAQLFPNRAPRNFAEWVSARFGRRLYEIFFEGYTEKLWGIRCTEISADWAAQRIKGLSLLKAVRNALLGNDGKVKSLIDQFQFPRLGSGQLYERTADYLTAHGQTVLLDTEVVGLHRLGERVTALTLKDRQSGREAVVECSAVISSIPLSLLVQQLEPAAPAEVLAAARSLKFRNTVLVYVFVEGEDLFPDNWLYINDPTVELGRVTNFANWSQDMLGDRTRTPLCCEYWCQFDGTWKMPDHELVARAGRDLRRIGLLGNQKVSDGFVVRLPRTYPIYAGNYKQALATIQDYLGRFANLQAVGRYGAFKYNNQDHSLLMGILAAENVASPGKHDLWSVNSDSEYQEEAKSGEKTTPAPPQPPVTGGWKLPEPIARLGSQMGGYLITGGLATVVDVAIFAALTQLGLWYVAALCVSFFAGLTTNFVLSRRFVFGVYWHNWRLQFVVFATVALNSLLANLGLLQLLINDAQMDATVARLISAACVAVLSFTGHRLYSFANNERAVGAE